MRAKRAKLEAWKKEREAKKALDEAKAKAMALAGKAAPGEFDFRCCADTISQHLI
jgi:ATP-dependent RNA helicase DDX46/PRP5